MYFHKSGFLMHHKAKDTVIVITLICSSLMLGVFFRRFRKTPPGVLLRLPFYGKELKRENHMDISIGNFSRIFPIHFTTILYAKTDYLFTSAEIEIRAFAMLGKSPSYKPGSQATGFMNDQDISQ